MTFNTYGNKENQSLLLIPGLGVSYEIFLPLIELLNDQYYMVAVGIDGFLIGQESDFTSVDDQAAQAIGYVQKNLNGHLDVAYGLSLGGKILSRILERNEIVIDHAIMDAAPMLPLPKWSVDPLRYYQSLNVWTCYHWTGFWRWVFHSHYFDVLLDECKKVWPYGKGKAVRDGYKDVYTNKLESIHGADIHFWYGTKEAFVAKPQVDHLLKLCPEAHVEVFSGMNHGQLLVDHPEEIARRIKLLSNLMETDRIMLRPWRESDAPALFKYASDPEVGPRAGWPPHKSVEESLEIIRTVFNDATNTWAIVLKETGEPVGAMGYGPSCQCNLPAREGEPLIGYWVGRPYWNRGICTEALRLMLDHIRRTTEIKSLISGHFIDNPASGRVMEKCGFIPTGETVVDLEQGKDTPIRVLRLNLLSVRAANTEDTDAIMSVLEAAKGIMRESGNLGQWVNGYPSNDVICNDIDSGYGFVVMQKERVVGYFAYIPSPEPTYATIYEGKWLENTLPYHVVHRIGSYPEVHGVFNAIMDWCFAHDRNIRIDTHRDNLIMQHNILKYGFKYCGIIYLASGDERLAYQNTNNYYGL